MIIIHNTDYYLTIFTVLKYVHEPGGIEES